MTENYISLKLLTITEKTEHRPIFWSSFLNQNDKEEKTHTYTLELRLTLSIDCQTDLWKLRPTRESMTAAGTFEPDWRLV
jgi:hypothetical protein